MDPGSGAQIPRAAEIAWVTAAYLAGTLPSTWLVARATHATALQAEAGRRAGETDPHVLMTKHLGWAWTVAATTTDVLKGLLVVLAARELGGLPDAWLAAAGVGAVLGHAFPFFLRRWAGRGLATAAGVLLVLLPAEMALAGLLILFGYLIHATGLLSTIAMASVPVLAAARGQPEAFVWMAAAILVILLLRRLEGVGEVVAAGASWPRALLWRAVLDASAPAGPEPNGTSG